MSSAQERDSWPYSRGFQNCPETCDPATLKVHGKIPKWLEGVLYRTGPGTYKIPSKKNPEIVFSFDHWFDGLGQDICENIFQKFFTVFQASISSNNPEDDPNSRNVNVTLTTALPHPEGNSTTLVLGTDANSLKSIDPITLEPIQNFSFKKFHLALSGPMAPAHYQYDAETGEYISFVSNPGAIPEYNIFSIKTDEETGKPITTILATIPLKLAYIHSFSMTKKYIIFILWQCDFAMNGAKILWERNMIRSFVPWDPNQKTHFYVIDRNLKKHVATYTFPTFYCFHTINAYDEGDDIIIDLSQYKDNSVIFQLTVNRLSGSETNADKLPLQFDQSRVHRYKLCNISKNLDSADLKYGSDNFPNAELVFATSEDLNIELPVVNFSRYYMKKYRYVYGISYSGSNPHIAFDRLIKIDLHRTENDSFNHKIWQQFGCIPSEPIFVPSPSGVEEDDGVITSVVLDGTKNTSFLLILDAKSFKEIARAEMEHGKVVPYGFHGLWNKL
ncbi:21880_t:CDS:2 [Dentiscutata erythropus]|uniref:21880_t:CDS:1 n=1 Tax=Dentiscutata erythropus TaxID=1348616 RepID=A0A9N9DE32_9GLOM|nr:21880_t:CDS:2 [Dentiscutata erythropus]